MYNKKFIFVIFLILFLSFGCAKKNLISDNSPRFQKASEQNLKKYINELVSDKMEGREGGTLGEAEASLYLARKLKNLGIKPFGDEDTYFQAFPLGNYMHVLQEGRVTFNLSPGKSLNSSNVLGIINGKNKDGDYLILSAHYDHLGRWNNDAFPGANDNASGVATILEITRLLKNENPLDINIIIAFWGSEEKGLVGSQYFVNNLKIDKDKIKGVINLDSIGTCKDKNLLKWGYFDFLEISLGNKDWKIISEEHGKRNSDHSSFLEQEIPAITLLASTWLENNHTVNDTIDTLEWMNLRYLAEDIARVILELDENEG